MQNKLLGLMFCYAFEFKIRKMNFKKVISENKIDLAIFGFIIYLMKPSEKI